MKTEIILLRDACAELYPDELDIRRIVAEAELNLLQITFSTKAVNVWQSVMIEAQNVGRIDALIKVVERYYATNVTFCQARDAYWRASGQLGQSTNQTYAVKAARPDREPLMNCVQEMAAFHDLLTNAATTQRAILLQGDHGCGKTRLLTEYRRLAEAQGRKVIEFDLGKQLSIEHCLERIVNNCVDPSRFTAFEQSLNKKKPEILSRQADWHIELTRSFFADLRAQRTAIPIFVFFDHLEKADRPLRSWLLDEFVARLADRPLIAVLAGHAELDRVKHLEWVRFFTPKIPQIDDFYKYAAYFDVEVEPTLMSVLFKSFHTKPVSFVTYIETMCTQQRGQLA